MNEMLLSMGWVFCKDEWAMKASATAQSIQIIV
jgi:hypothetical protein